MKKYVVDASVTLKWIFEEEDSKKARELLRMSERGKIMLLAPDLWTYEMISAITTAVRRKKITVAKAEEMMRMVMKAGLKLISVNDIAERIVRISIKYDISGYDAAYIGLAKANSLILVTADEALVRKVDDMRIVSSLKDFRNF